LASAEHETSADSLLLSEELSFRLLLLEESAAEPSADGGWDEEGSEVSSDDGGAMSPSRLCVAL
jgi:hypothetical protein